MIVDFINLTIEDLDKMDRDLCIEFLEWNDPNGWYSDESSLAEGLPPITLEEAKEIIINQVFSN